MKNGGSRKKGNEEEEKEETFGSQSLPHDPGVNERARRKPLIKTQEPKQWKKKINDITPIGRDPRTVRTFGEEKRERQINASKIIQRPM